MICPHCGFDNLPGSEECGRCQQDLTQLDRPVAHDRVERSLMEDPVSALQPRPPITVRPTTSVRDAIRTMLDANVGALLVVDEAERVVGIFTERDVLLRIVDRGRNPATLPLGEVMTTEPETLPVSASIAYLLNKMSVGGFRHVPVVDEQGRPVFVVAVRDVVELLVKSFPREILNLREFDAPAIPRTREGA
jgi:CBS domain-containing protein